MTQSRRPSNQPVRPSCPSRPWLLPRLPLPLLRPQTYPLRSSPHPFPPPPPTRRPRPPPSPLRRPRLHRHRPPPHRRPRRSLRLLRLLLVPPPAPVRQLRRP